MDSLKKKSSCVITPIQWFLELQSQIRNRYGRREEDAVDEWVLYLSPQWYPRYN